MFDDAQERLLRLAERGHERNALYRLVHVHIPKTAGMSFLKVVPHGIIRSYDEYLHLPWNRSGALWAERIAGGSVPRFTTGHIRFEEVFAPAGTASLGLMLLSVVRDPLSRVISDYNYMRSEAHPDNARFYAANPDFEVYLQHRIRQPNLMAQWLCGHNNNAERLRAAVQRHYCGLAPLSHIDRYSDSIQCAFAHSYYPMVHRNELQTVLHGEKLRPSDIPSSLVDLFRAANDLDVRLYESCETWWDKHATEMPDVTLPLSSGPAPRKAATDASVAAPSAPRA